MRYIDQKVWEQALAHADWYLRIGAEYKRLIQLSRSHPELNDAIKEEVYSTIESALSRNRLLLAQNGNDLDVARLPIDRMVIHHSKARPGMTLQRLNAIQLLRIYGMYYANPTDPKEQHFKGEPVWSGHFYKDQQVFWGYHWFIRNDGSAERILDDKYVGWHAGNWGINCRSIGICIDDDLTQAMPQQRVLDTIAAVIKDNYHWITADQVIGHLEANPHTVCPGEAFMKHWKASLQKLVVASL